MMRGLPVTDPLEMRPSCTCKRVLQKHPLRTARIRSCRTRTAAVHMFRTTYAGACLSGCGVRPVFFVPGRVHNLQVFLHGLMVIPVVTADFLDFPVRCTVPDIDRGIVVCVIPVAATGTQENLPVPVIRVQIGTDRAELAGIVRLHFLEGIPFPVQFFHELLLELPPCKGGELPVQFPALFEFPDVQLVKPLTTKVAIFPSPFRGRDCLSEIQRCPQYPAAYAASTAARLIRSDKVQVLLFRHRGTFAPMSCCTVTGTDFKSSRMKYREPIL